MSKKQKKALSAAQEDQSTNFVYDFLYHDARRIGSFLAQFDPLGHLQHLTQTDSVGGHATSKTAGESGLSSIVVAKAAASAEATEEQRQELARVYDPLWANALTLLEYLDERELIKRDMHSASIGKFVLIKGILKILDLRLLRDAWEMPKFLERIGIGDREKFSKEQLDSNQLGMDLIRILPHTIQAQIFAGKGDTFSASWMTLEETGMVVSTGDILMKHGHIVGGEWAVVGIKDANPDGGPRIDKELQELLAVGFEHAAQKRYSTPIAILAEQMAPLARLALGRHGAYYGITPLMIFRELAG